MNTHPAIEPLEARISPASIVNPYTVSYLDENNQVALIQFSKPLFTSATAAGNILQFVNTSGGSISESFTGNSTEEILSLINLLGPTGTTLKTAQDMSISVKSLPYANVLPLEVGYIAAANFSTLSTIHQVTQNIDLGNITIQGNLGGITVGDNFSTPAIQTLSVQSMSTVQESDVLGPIVSLHDAGDFATQMNIIGGSFGTINHLYIGGSLTANNTSSGNALSFTTGSSVSPGFIQFTGSIGTATIGNIVGGSETDSGSILGSAFTASSIGSLHVTGANTAIPAIAGGSGANSGEIFTNTSIGKITLGGSLQGGSGSFSGFLDTSISMGKVVISGDVTGGTAGTGTDATGTAGYSGAIKSPTISSLSISGTLAGGTGTDSGHTANTSGVISVNKIPSLSIGGGIQGGGGFKSGAVSSSGFTSAFGAVTIQGDVTGGGGAKSGTIASSGFLGGTIGSLHIGGNLRGGAGANSGEISTGSALQSLQIGGSLLGDAGANSGEISIGSTLQSLQIGGSLLGGAGANSGEISTGSALGTLNIAKNVTGGTADTTGAILVGGSLNSAIIGGSFAASSAINSSSAISQSGYLQAGHIGTLTIDGDVTAYANAGTGGISNSGAICSTADIGTLTIDGSVTGVSAADPVVISAAHGINKTKKPATTDLAIGSVILNELNGATVSYLDILAGYSATAGSVLGSPVDGSAQIGLVSATTSVTASNIVAGCNQGADGYFGTGDDTAITGGDTNSAIQSKIASIVVGGAFTGDGTSGHTFAFEAQQLTSVSVNHAVPPTIATGVGGKLQAVEVTI